MELATLLDQDIQEHHQGQQVGCLQRDRGTTIPTVNNTQSSIRRVEWALKVRLALEGPLDPG